MRSRSCSDARGRWSAPGVGRRRDDTGMVTAELAVVLPVLALVTTLLVAIVGVAGDAARASDAARSGARSLSIGTPRDEIVARVLDLAPAGAAVDITSDGTLVRVSVQVPARRWGPIRLPAPDVTAVAVLEPGVTP